MEVLLAHRTSPVSRARRFPVAAEELDQGECAYKTQSNRRMIKKRFAEG